MVFEYYYFFWPKYVNIKETSHFYMIFVLKHFSLVSSSSALGSVTTISPRLLLLIFS